MARGSYAATPPEAPCRSLRARRRPQGRSEGRRAKGEKRAGETAKKAAKEGAKTRAGRSRRTSLTIALHRRAVRDASRQHDPSELHERWDRFPVEIQELDTVRTLARGC